MAEKVIDVPGMGLVSFPESLSDEFIGQYVQKEVLKNGAGAPGPAQPPRPAGLVSQYANPFNPSAPVRMEDVPKHQQFEKEANEGQVKQNKNEVKAMAALMPFLGGPGSLAMKGVVGGLGAATTETPGDLATLAATGGAASALKGAKFAGRGANMVNRMLQGMGLYEGGTRLNDALNGREQRPLDPRKRSVTDLGLGALSGALGVAQGMHEVPRPPAPKPAFMEAMEKFKANQAQQQTFQGEADSLANSLGNLKIQREKVSATLRPMENALKDANEKLKASNQQMKGISLSPTEFDSIQASDDSIKGLQDKIGKWKDRLGSGQFNTAASAKYKTELQSAISNGEKQLKVLNHKKILDEVRTTLEQKRKTESFLDEIGISQTELNERASKHARTKPPVMSEPQDSSKSLDAKKIFHALITRGVVPSMTGAGLSHLGGIDPMWGVGTGAVLDQLTQTDAGKKMVDFLTHKVGPNASQLVGPVANSRQGQ